MGLTERNFQKTFRSAFSSKIENGLSFILLLLSPIPYEHLVTKLRYFGSKSYTFTTDYDYYLLLLLF